MGRSIQPTVLALDLSDGGNVAGAKGGRGRNGPGEEKKDSEAEHRAGELSASLQAIDDPSGESKHAVEKNKALKEMAGEGTRIVGFYGRRCQEYEEGK